MSKQKPKKQKELKVTVDTIDQYMTSEEAASYLGMSRQWLHQMDRKGLVTVYMIASDTDFSKLTQLTTPYHKLYKRKFYAKTELAVIKAKQDRLIIAKEKLHQRIKAAHEQYEVEISEL